MKSFKKIIYSNAAILLMALLIAGCQEETNAKPEENNDVVDSTTEKSAANKEAEQSESKTTTGKKDPSNSDSSKGSEEEKSGESSSNSDESNDQGEKVDLSSYSNEEIEYARVWLQLAPNQQIDEMYVRKITAGSPVKADLAGSAVYPEDVIQLKGTRLIDGAVTYSGNGDGTINVYNVPARWNEKLTDDDNKEEVVKTTKGIVQNTKEEYIDPVKSHEIIELIGKIQVVD